MAAMAEIERLKPASGNSKPRTYIPKRKLIQVNDSAVIRNGFLYTGVDSRKRSLSIGSGTFELLQAKDLESIEAVHSRRPSPTGDVETFLELPEIKIIEDSLKREEVDEVNTPLKTTKSQLKQDQESKDIERLSQQLTEVNGIANFKGKQINNKDLFYLFSIVIKIVGPWTSFSKVEDKKHGLKILQYFLHYYKQQTKALRYSPLCSTL